MAVFGTFLPRIVILRIFRRQLWLPSIATLHILVKKISAYSINIEQRGDYADVWAFWL